MSNTKAKMNLPNRLTVLRMAMIPVFLVALLIPYAKPYNILIGGLLFGIAAITDLLDGKIARKRNLVTNFGKFWDPIADKMLVIAAMISLIPFGWMSTLYVAATVVVVAREFFVTGVKLMAAGGGKVVAANIWGKLKTTFQMSFVGFAFLREFFNGLPALTGGIVVTIMDILVIFLAAGMIALTLYSALVYYQENREYMQMDR